MNHQYKYEDHNFRMRYFSARFLLLTCLVFTFCTTWPELKLVIYSHHQNWRSYTSLIAIFSGYMLLTSMVDYSTKVLDKKSSWSREFTKRIYLQLLFGCLTPLIITFSLIKLALFILEMDLSHILYTGHSFFLILFIVVTLNALYMGAYFSGLLHKDQKIKKKQKNDSSKAPVSAFLNYKKHIVIPNGHDEIQIPLIDVSYLFRDGRDILLKTHNGSIFAFWRPLDKIEKELDPALFCRISRSCIISRQAFLKYEDLSGGGMLIFLKQRIEIKVSRDKAHFVKSWLEKKEEAQTV